MTALGIVLLLSGIALVVAEAHVPSGVLGAAGGVVLVAAVAVLATAVDANAMVAVPVAAGLLVAAGAWGVLAARSVSHTQRARMRSGPEALSGRIGVVRAWSEPDGQVYLDGELWRARHSWGADEEADLHEGDAVIVERLAGLTLCVRRADEWELIA
jgi:membrane-bound serine protease (ClpP class)